MDEAHVEGGNIKEGIVEIDNDNKQRKKKEKCASDHKKTIKNLISAVIILSGVVAGSFFVDIVQFISGNGYSQRALEEVNVFVAGERTWVAFEDPAVEVSILTVSDEELTDCEACDPSEVVLWLKRFVPTLISKKVEIASPEGKKLIEDYNLKSIPAFVFSKNVEDSEFFQSEASVLFEEDNGSFILNATGLGIPVGKYLETPSISENNPQKGNAEGKIKIVTYLDFQCPYCQQFFETIESVSDEFSDNVLLVFKDMLLDFHPRADVAAIAARCAQEQDAFWEMSRMLYTKQDEWGGGTGTDQFRSYAKLLKIDITKFNECIDSERHLDEIEADSKEADDFGISGTPATFVNEEFIGGVVEAEQLRDVIQNELSK